MRSGNWRRPIVDLGIQDTLCSLIEKTENADPNALPDLRRGNTIIVVSDYGGCHRGSSYESLSLLFADLEALNEWENRRRAIRGRLLSDGRRISFKTLTDRLKQRVPGVFLTAADAIPGLSLTILINKKVSTLFTSLGGVGTSKSDFEAFRTWKPHTLERLLRVCHIVGLILAGLSRANQNVIWITDQDDFAANDKMIRGMTNMSAWVSSTYLSHTLGHLRCGTTKSDDGSRALEDLAALPDLIAGALANVMTSYWSNAVTLPTSVIVPPPVDIPPKVREIMNWFATSQKKLKRLVITIDPIPNSMVLQFRRLKFHSMIVSS